MPANNFTGPIPGESLTRTPGGSTYERPPQFVDLNEALEYMFTSVTAPKSVAMIVHVLEKGGTIEAVVRTLLMRGFMEGKWTVDLALLMAKIMVPMIAAVAVRAGIPASKLKVKNPDRAFQKFVKETQMGGAEELIPNGE